MVQICLTSASEIDYSVLTGRMKKSEGKNPQLVGETLLRKFMDSSLLSEDEKEILLKLSQREKSERTPSYKYGRTKTGAITHEHEFIYKHGIAHQTGYTLVQIDLVPCFLQLIQVISHISKDVDVSSDDELTALTDDVAELIAATVEDDNRVQETLDALVNINNPYLNLFIDKAISFMDIQNIKVLDAFNVERSYHKLFPIESIIIPIHFSLYTLQYILVEKLRDFYRRGEKRFVCIDKYRIYYFVRNDIVDKFITNEVTLEGIKLNVNFNIIKPSVEVNNEYGI